MTEGGDITSGGNSVGCYRTLENESNLQEHATLDQICKLKRQLTTKEEELKTLRKNHRR